MKEILILRSNAVYSDPRVIRIVKSLKEDFSLHLFGWNKKKASISGNEIEGIQIEYFNGPFEGNKLSKLFTYIKWFISIFKMTVRSKYDVIYCCDFDTFFPALLGSKISGKKIVYDIFDFYADMLFMPSNVLKNIVRWLDISSMPLADLVILADDNRRNQIKADRLNKLIAIYNSPPDLLEEFQTRVEEDSVQDLIYLGLIDMRQRDLGFVIDFFEHNPNYSFSIYGRGIHLEDLKKRCLNIPNVRVFDPVSYAEALQISYNSRVILSVYDPKIENNINASPNKLFESMMLNRPSLINEEVANAELVHEYNCGKLYKFGSVKSFGQAFKSIVDYPSKEKELGDNARKVYDEIFHFDKQKKKLVDAISEMIAL